MKSLKPGDRCYFVSPGGLKLRCRVDDNHLGLKARGEASNPLVPVVRIIARRRAITRAEGGTGPKVRWVPRADLRKLPTRRITPTP